MGDEEKIEQVQREMALWEEVRERGGVERARALLALSKILWERNKYEESLIFSESARDMYLEVEGEQYIEELTDVNFGIMINLDMLDRPKEAAEAASKVIELYKVTNHPMLGEILRDQGRYWYTAREYEKSLKSHLEAISLVDFNLTNIEQGIDLLNIAMANYKLTNYEVAILDLQKAILIFKGERDPHWVSKCHGVLAEIYMEKQDPDEIEEWARKALDYAKLVDDDQGQSILNYYLGVAHRIKKEIDVAEVYFEKAKILLSQMSRKDWETLIKVERELSNIQALRGEFEKAKETLRRIETIEETLLIEPQ